MPKEHHYFVYIITNKHNTVLYTGISNSLAKRIYQHKEKQFKNSFTYKYNIDKLVYYERFQWVHDAIAREKQIKAGSRANKIKLIESMNPVWLDLFENIYL